LDNYDSIVIGAGHNGLTCAAYLAKSGQPGGLATTREFHPGFHASVAHSICHFPQKIASDLDLVKHGFSKTVSHLPTVGLGAENIEVRDGTVEGVSIDDANAYHELSTRMRRFAKALRPFWLKTMPRIGNNSLAEAMTFAHIGLNIRQLGRTDMQEFLRIASLPARDLMDEHFQSDVLKATLSWDGLLGSKMAPRSPNSAVLAMLYRMAGESAGAHSVPTGGIGSLIKALCASAEASGAEIRCAAPVARILIEGDANGLVAKGVQLTNGDRIAADRVISAVDPKNTFLKLVGVEFLDIGFSNRIRRLRCDGYVAKLHLALNDLPDFGGLERPNGRVIVAPDMEAIELAFDDAKYGELPAMPVIEFVIPTLHEPSLAPAGQHILSAHVMYVPYRLKGGWTAAARDQIRERTIDTLERHAPGIREQIISSEILTPADLEREFRVTGGHWHHTEFATDQMLMMRPTYEAGQYRTPIPGLSICSAGSHPGGDLVGAAGHNAAREILR
jgi:phytoene dehydrogenase-like protein